MKDWRRVEQIFGAALELEPAERTAFIRQACEDRETLQEIESLLAYHDKAAATFLDQPLSVPDDELIPPEPPASGETVGVYRLLEKIGEGGMGTVYLGERADGAFERRVAVKVLRRGMQGLEASQRFELERRILASLDHSGIARLLDGGTTSAGSPYVVMEMIDGEPIDRYCDRRELSVDQRVDLFLEVLEAVASAHRSLVVHRDLKPSNVFVDREGRVKLLDFGIAKMLDPEEMGESGEMTSSWQRMLTRNYSSPEQVRGERITVATDVYLLGILLYKLLSGRLPHRFSSQSLAEVEAALTGGPPQPPSHALREILNPSANEGESPAKGVDRIDSDLDHITLMALRSDPSERYGSVVELREDLQRYRQGLPIRARVGSRRYRARKFVRRHWRPLASIGLALMLLTTFTLDRTMQVERRDLALRQAEAALARSEALLDFVSGLFWGADPQVAKGQKLTVTEALARGERRLAQGGVDSPYIEASIHALFGQIRFDLGHVDQARSSLEQALELFRATGEAEGEEAQRIAELRVRGDLALARFQQLGSLQDEGAEEVVAATTREAQRVYEESRWLEGVDPDLALELSDPLAEIYCWLEEWQEVAPLTEEAMDLIRSTGEAETLPVAQALGRRALVLRNLEEDPEGARALYEEALGIFLAREGPVHPEVANLHNQLGLIAAGLGDPEAAFTHHRSALEVRLQLYPEGHGDIHRSLSHHGDLHRQQGVFERAADRFREAMLLSEEIHPVTSSWRVKYALSLSETLIDAGHLDEAEARLQIELSPEYRARRPPNSRMITHAEGLLGAVLLAQGKTEGGPLLRRSLETLRHQPNGYEGAIVWLEAFSEKIRPGLE